MPGATRLGDKNSGHDSCVPTSLTSGSSNVLINGKPAGRVGDTYSSHGCIAHSSHNDVIASGSGSVFINGLPAARIGDSVSIGGIVVEGSSNVIIGG